MVGVHPEGREAFGDGGVPSYAAAGIPSRSFSCLAPYPCELTAFAERGGFEVLGIFKETASGARDNRLARNRVLELAQARRIDAVLVPELSRWGRSTQDLLETLYKLAG